MGNKSSWTFSRSIHVNIGIREANTCVNIIRQFCCTVKADIMSFVIGIMHNAILESIWIAQPICENIASTRQCQWVVVCPTSSEKVAQLIRDHFVRSWQIFKVTISIHINRASPWSNDSIKFRPPCPVLTGIKILGTIRINDTLTIYEPSGCPKCDNTGYKGRVAIIEALRIDAQLDEQIAKRATLGELRACAKSTGYKTLADDAIRCVLEGKTSLTEVSRVIDLTQRLS